MKTTKTKNNKRCKKIRYWLFSAISKRFGPEATWLNDHIMRCPRCQQRLVSCGRVNLALSFMKSQPHGLDLLMRANAQAIAVLKHSLRQEPKAHVLGKKLPEPKMIEKYNRYGHSLMNLAESVQLE